MSVSDQELRKNAPLFMKLIDELEKAQREGSAADRAIAARYQEEVRKARERRNAQLEIALEPSGTPVSPVLDPALYDAAGALVDLSGARDRPQTLGEQAQRAAARIAEAKRRNTQDGRGWRRILNENMFDERGYEISSQQALVEAAALDVADGQGLMNNIKTFVGALTGMIGVFGFPRPVVDAIIAGTAEILLNHYRSRYGPGRRAEDPAKITRPIEFEDI